MLCHAKYLLHAAGGAFVSAGERYDERHADDRENSVLCDRLCRGGTVYCCLHTAGIRQHLSCHLCGVGCAPCGACREAEKDSAVLFREERPCRPDLLHHERLRRAGAEPIPFCRAAVRRNPLHYGHRRVDAVFQLAHGACRRLAAAGGVCHRIACLRRAEKALPQSNSGKGRLRGRHSGVHGSDARSARQQCRGEIPFGTGKENPCRREPPRPERAGNGCLCGFRGTCPAAGYCHHRPCGRGSAGKG